MKNILVLLIIVMISACTTSYQDLKPMNSFEELDYPFPVKTVTLASQISLAYSDEGTGQPIIFIHGLASYMPAWKKNVAELKKNYRCISIDLPGYGKSEKAAFDGSMEFYAKTLVEFMDALQLPKATLAGHSMGGQISMVTALLYPDRVDKLILTAPAGFETFNEGEKQWFREVVTSKLTKLTTPQQIVSNYYSNFYDFPADAEFMIEDRLAMRSAIDFDWYCYIIPKSVEGMVNRPVFDQLDQIETPTLILFGENDNLIPNRFLHGGNTIDIAMAGHQKIKGSQLYMIPKAGHFVQFEQAELYNERVREFLK